MVPSSAALIARSPLPQSAQAATPTPSELVPPALSMACAATLTPSSSFPPTDSWLNYHPTSCERNLYETKRVVSYCIPTARLTHYKRGPFSDCYETRAIKETKAMFR